MNTYISLFVSALVASLVLTPVVRRLCEQSGWLDDTHDARRIHARAVPRLGGIAIFASVLIALVVPLAANNYVTQTIQEGSRQLLAVFLPATLIFLFGVYDDLRGSKASQKFIAQGLAGALLFFLGVRIEGMTLPIFGPIEFAAWVSFALTVGWTVGISNAFNLIDGMDGLAAGATLFAALVMLAVSLLFGHQLVAVCALAIAGAVTGFLRYNFNPASIFMGDSGSLFLGFMLAALSIQGAQKASTMVAVAIPILAFGVPLFDMSIAITRRFISGRPVFQADREHVHHMLLARGWSQQRVALVLYGCSAVLGLASLLFVTENGGTTALALIVVGAVVTVGVSRLQYHEVDEIKASMKRNVAERRTRTINNIRVRRASRALSNATTLGELFGGVGEMLDLSEFVYATVQLGRGGDTASTERAIAREKGGRLMRGAEVRNGLIYWSWERGDIDSSEVIGSGHFWSLRLPLMTEHAGWGYINLYRSFDSDALLLDINYLCNLFQREMAQAAERVFTVPADEISKPVRVVGLTHSA